MNTFRKNAIVAGVLLAAFSTPAFAINSDAECAGEGGTMVKVKGSDYCLVPIRPAEYADPVYDGNQLGVVECPGNKLNDGLYCMYPVTLNRKDAEKTSTDMPAETDKATVSITTDADADVKVDVEKADVEAMDAETADE